MRFVCRGGEYRFRLIAHNDEGTSEPSDWTPFRLVPPPLNYSVAQPPPSAPPPQPVYQNAMRPMPLLPQMPPPMMPPPVSIPVSVAPLQSQSHIPHHPSSTSSSSGHHSSHSHQSNNSYSSHQPNGHGPNHGPPASSSNGPIHNSSHSNRRQIERIPTPSKPYVLNNNHEKHGGPRKKFDIAWKISGSR